MNILIIHHFGGIGGGLKSCIDIAKMMKNCGHCVTVGLPSPDMEVKKLFKKEGIDIRTDIPRVITLNYHSASSSATIALGLYMLSVPLKKRWKSFFNEVQYDTIVLNSMVQSPLVNLVKQSGKKCVVFIRETIKKNNRTFVNQIIKRKITRSDALVFLTKYDQRTWDFSGKVQQYVIPDVVDSNSFIKPNFNIAKRKKILGIEGEDTTFIYLGGFSYVKGALDLLLAFEAYITEGNKGHLLVLGNGNDDFIKQKGLKRWHHKRDIEYVEKCREVMMRINGEKENVTFVGLTKSPEDWYVISDVVVFPVKAVHQARPIYEAGFFNETVIVSNYSNFAEALVDGYNGMFYEAGNIDDLKDKMTSISKNKSVMKIMADNNRLMYIENHTFENAERKINNLLVKLG